MQLSLGVLDNKRGLKAQARAKIERLFVATFPSQECSVIAAKSTTLLDDGGVQPVLERVWN
jgi:hypothetical protein